MRKSKAANINITCNNIMYQHKRREKKHRHSHTLTKLIFAEKYAKKHLSQSY